MEIDIFQRACKKLSAPREEPLIEEQEEEKEPELSIDEEMVEEEEEFDCAKVQMELDAMRNRILELQMRLKIKCDQEIPKEECVDLEVLLTCSENKEICALQKAEHKLQCQIKDLLRCCQLARDQINELRQQLCDKAREILQLQRMVALLESWRLTLDHEYGICIERFEYLKTVKAEWADVEKKLDEQKACLAEFRNKFVSRQCFTVERRRFVTEFNTLATLYKEMFQQQMEKIQALEKRMTLNEELLTAGQTILPVIEEPNKPEAVIESKDED